MLGIVVCSALATKFERGKNGLSADGINLGLKLGNGVCVFECNHGFVFCCVVRVIRCVVVVGLSKFNGFMESDGEFGLLKWKLVGMASESMVPSRRTA